MFIKNKRMLTLVRENLQYKFAVIFTLVGIVPFLMVGIYSYVKAKSSLNRSNLNHLLSIREIKKNQIRKFFQEKVDDAGLIASMPLVEGAIGRLGALAREARRRGYASKDLVNFPPMKKIFDEYYEFFQKYNEAYDFYDLYLITPGNGQIVLSLALEDDLGSFLSNEKTHLANGWREMEKSQKIVITDVEPYTYAKEEPAIFVIAPAIVNNRYIGSIGFQLSFEAIGEIMNERSGLGKTGETYLVGKDYLMRSNSFLSPKTHSVTASFKNRVLGSVNTEGVRLALAGASGAKVMTDYRGEKVLCAYTPINIFGNHWAFLAQIDENEAFKDLYSVQIGFWVLGILIIVLVVFIGRYLGRSLSMPIIAITNELNKTTREIQTAIQQQAASTKEQASAVHETTTTMEEINQAGSQISQRAKQVAEASKVTSGEADKGLRSLHESNRAMITIREQVELVAENIVNLSEKTQAISEIINTVNDIAEQSNLLALNAAIEAISAGEQGQRFSVVANEIKSLADRAKDSTVQVRSILGEIQKGINSTVLRTEEAVKRVELGMAKFDLTADSIRQLTETMDESIQAFQQIVAGTNQQQIGLEQVTLALKSINSATEQTAASVTHIDNSIGNISIISQELKKLVENYKKEMN